MPPRAAHLIETLGLAPHPEGGHYREVFRSSAEVDPADGRPARSALTTIYFLLAGGEHSRWHRVASDEVWHLLEGDPLDLLVSTDAFSTVETVRLGSVGEGARPVHVVPAGAWQAARTTGAYSLVGCTVGPGFDFADFELIDAHPDLAEMARQHADAAPFA
ncbi:MAG: cupin domain-containing protein [Bacteroidota bacterium]